MANQEHVDLLTQGVPGWNAWREQNPFPRPLSEETYKHMWILRYQQHMGQMSFLELLDKYEEIVGISPQT